MAGAGLLLTAFYLAPASAYLYNATEVSVSLTAVLKAGWPAQLLLAGLVAILMRLGPKIRVVASSLLLALMALLYLQGHVLVWDYGRFDGSDIDFSRHDTVGVVELLLWGALPVAALLLRRRLLRWTLPLTVAILLLQCVSLGASLGGGRDFRPATRSELHPDLFRFSSERNVLMVVLDAFQATALDELRRRDPSIDERLDGFTYFDDATGVYPTTLMSIPAMLSGKTYDNTRPIREFMTEALGEGSLPALLREHDFSTQIVVKPSYCEFLSDGHCVGQSAFLGAGAKAAEQTDVLRIWDVALFRHLPHYLKSRVYDEHAWLLQRSFGRGAEKHTENENDDELMEPTAAQQASWDAWEQFVGAMERGSDRPTFKFLHLYTSHSPFLLDENCARLSKKAYQNLPDSYRMVNQCACALSQIYAILDGLREMRVLDQTMVIVTADHGSKIELIATPRDRKLRLPNFNRVFPLLLVKPFGAEGPLQSSHAPVSLIDLPQTIAQALELEASFPGQSLFAPATDGKRRRVFYDYTWQRGAWEARYLPRVQEYFIEGPARIGASWEAGRGIHAPE